MDDADMAMERELRLSDAALHRGLAAARKPLSLVSRSLCIDCGGTIPPARLKAMPGCQRCVDCQEEMESGS